MNIERIFEMTRIKKRKILKMVGRNPNCKEEEMQFNITFSKLKKRFSK